MSKLFLYKVEDVGSQKFVVKSKVHELEKFTITLDLQINDGMCECQNSKFVGILCAHILKVFAWLEFDAIPDHFIIPWWKKKANKFRIIDYNELVHDDGNEESKALRLSHMCQQKHNQGQQEKKMQSIAASLMNCTNDETKPN